MINTPFSEASRVVLEAEIAYLPMNLPLKTAVFILRRTLLASTVAVLALLPCADAATKDDKPPELDSPAKVKPGTTALLKAAGKGMRYFLRVPKKYDARNGSRLIVFLHGLEHEWLGLSPQLRGEKSGVRTTFSAARTGENGTDPFGTE
jgi:hypothetical protein